MKKARYERYLRIIIAPCSPAEAEFVERIVPTIIMDGYGVGNELIQANLKWKSDL